MKFALVGIVLILSGCASEQLKKCPTDFVEDSVMSCPAHIEGDFYMCSPHPKLKRCVGVQ